jgi:hypothetical protein
LIAITRSWCQYGGPGTTSIARAVYMVTLLRRRSECSLGGDDCQGEQAVS